MTTDLDALEALAKAAIINDDPEDWPLEGAVGWDRPEDNKLVAALTPGTVLALIAELRQERDRTEQTMTKMTNDREQCWECIENPDPTRERESSGYCPTLCDDCGGCVACDGSC